MKFNTIDDLHNISCNGTVAGEMLTEKQKEKLLNILEENKLQTKQESYGDYEIAAYILERFSVSVSRLFDRENGRKDMIQIDIEKQ